MRGCLDRRWRQQTHSLGSHCNTPSEGWERLGKGRGSGREARTEREVLAELTGLGGCLKARAVGKEVRPGLRRSAGGRGGGKCCSRN